MAEQKGPFYWYMSLILYLIWNININNMLQQRGEKVKLS